MKGIGSLGSVCSLCATFCSIEDVDEFRFPLSRLGRGKAGAEIETVVAKERRVLANGLMGKPVCLPSARHPLFSMVIISSPGYEKTGLLKPILSRAGFLRPRSQ
jgi:hypothetical protein